MSQKKEGWDCAIEDAIYANYKKMARRTDFTAMILRIDKDEMKIVCEKYLENSKFEDVVDVLEDSTPRFILITLEWKRQERKQYPLVLVHYSPEGSNPELNMLYSRMKPYLQKEFKIMFQFVEREMDELSEEWLIKKLSKVNTYV